MIHLKFWVAYPLDGSYAEARKKAEALMAARKVTREFGASTWGAPVDKSSLDGLRESVIPPRVYLTMKDDQLGVSTESAVGRNFAE